MTYRRAVERKGQREHHAKGLPFRIRIVSWWTRPDFRSNYMPAMATVNGREWWTIAYWHRFQIGPLILLWRTRYWRGRASQ